MAEDLTVIYLSASRLPQKMAEYARAVLKAAIGDTPLIAMTREPLDFGLNVLQTGEWSASNIYRQMLRAAKVAATPFVAVAEDDTLYPAEHFAWRPPADGFLYDMHRFSLFTWGEPLYSWRNRKSNSTLIAPRELLIDALVERFTKWPNGTPEHLTGEVGREWTERHLGLTPRKSVEVFSTVATINLGHAYGTNDRERRQRKGFGPMRAYDVPHWGHAASVVAKVQ